MQETRFVGDRGFFSIDVMKQCLNFFEPDIMRHPPILGFLKVALQSMSLDFQDSEATLKLIVSRMSDLRDGLFQVVKPCLCFCNFSREQRRIFEIGVHSHSGNLTTTQSTCGNGIPQSDFKDRAGFQPCQ